MVGRGTIKLNHRILQIGDPVPGAENWIRVEAWVRAGRLVEVR